VRHALPVAQQVEQLRQEHNIAIPLPLALLDLQRHALAVDMALEHFMRMNGHAAERQFSTTPSEDVRMRFTVRHETIYRYSAPVSLSLHLLRLNPRAEGVTILERGLTVDPKPIAFREETDRSPPRTRRRPCRSKAASTATASPRRSNMTSGSRPAERPLDWWAFLVGATRSPRAV
jgi:hypothetical protein